MAVPWVVLTKTQTPTPRDLSFIDMYLLTWWVSMFESMNKLIHYFFNFVKLVVTSKYIVSKMLHLQKYIKPITTQCIPG